MNIINKYCLFLLSVVEMLLLSGCHSLSSKIDTTFLPPENGRTVKISVDVPDMAELLPMKVMYRSNLCQKTYHNNEVPKYTVPGFNSEIIALEKRVNSSLYSTEIPYRGGGKCDWQLSNVTLRLTLKKNNSFTKDIVDIVGTGVIIIFDNNQPQQTGHKPIKIKGSFDIVEHYFPWVSDSFKNSNDISLWLYGKALFLYYQSRDAQQITWKPIIHSDIVVYSEYPAEEKTEGVSTIYSYPDGTKSANRNGKPDYNKLLSLIKPSS
ncbi:TPA: hypothetical protein ACKRTJ_001050 [Proteus mirabilis]|uniref:hypothetical protein n=2 Tax=Proteus mirabilis TaxID=584 RepID=UPI000538F89F|nr:hypothetical protein [Proteus mirabilis]AUU40228.1 hypothetical protein MC73_015105 [Proteus mirabilis]EJD6085486.1 hypothetical protein [Proteus mirabilis]ELA6786328.1 hypothetical protein [Proteus mirabilis]ELB1541344.1 hypothetical protein [Proteus mirabilis]MBG2804300.1 hypothetical protein [Proteus mirabilis]